MHSAGTVHAALELAAEGLSATVIARRLGVARETTRDWLKGAVPHSASANVCERCSTEHRYAELPPDYVYLLGLYLGDGCISVAPRNVFKLRIFLDTAYAGIIESTAAAMAAVRGKPVGTQRRPRNCVEVYSYWRCWPCLFPQHAPGKKHDRLIALVGWQERLVEQSPVELIRGLIHSDGCRFQNTGRRWSWPRYAFSNRSGDIREIFVRACDQMDVHCTSAGDKIYVSRKADVATLDRFIGPKA